MGGSKKRGGKKEKAAEMSEDEMLDQAAAQNKAAREQEVAEGCPTMAQLVASLDAITLFDLRVIESNGKGTQTCLSPAGDYIFYVDVNDAADAVQAAKTRYPCRLSVGTTPLGKAFGLTEGKAFGFSTNAQFPMRMQGPKFVIRDLVQAGLASEAKDLCPAALRSQLNQRTSAIPMFSLAELVEGTETAPYFFTKSDMVEYWMAATGKPQEELPAHLIMTDMRVLIVRMMQVPRDWKTIKIVPMASTVEMMRGMSAGKQARAEGAKAAAEAEAADAPPPLIEVA